jgi:hypothetical protein
LWNDYREQFYWWECVELVRKLILSSVLLLFDQGSPWQIALAALFSIACHLVYTHCRPMKDPRTHVLQHISLGLTTLNFFIGLMLKVEAVSASDASAGLLLISLNLIVALSFTTAVLHQGAKLEDSVARDASVEKQLGVGRKGSEGGRDQQAGTPNADDGNGNARAESTEAEGDAKVRGWTIFDADVREEGGAQRRDTRNPLRPGGTSGFIAAGMLRNPAAV